MKAYRLENVKLKTYSGIIIPVTIAGVFSDSYKAMENKIVRAFSGREDPIVKATFNMVEI